MKKEKSRFTVGIKSEDMSRSMCRGNINIQDNILKKIIDTAEFIIPKKMLPKLKDALDKNVIDRKFFVSWNFRF